MKKVLSMLIGLLLILCVCASALAESEQGYVLYYPSVMQGSEGETLVLDKQPERIVCLSNAALQILVRTDIHPIAVTSLTSSVTYPDWVGELPQIAVSMKSLDVESIIAMEPDLVIVGSYQKEAYGQLLADAGIPVYYTSEGPSIAYNETKEEAIVLARSFGGDELAAEIEAEFAKVEERAAAYTATHDPQTMMIFFHTPGTYQQTSQGYLGSMLSMLPFENLSDTIIDPSSRTATIDVETAVTLNPAIIFAISPTAPTADMLKATYEEAFAQNAALWNQMDAVAHDNIVYLSSEYVTSKGVQIVNSLNALIDLLEEKFPAQTQK